jgi:phosphonoacetate hydrolase
VEISARLLFLAAATILSTMKTRRDFITIAAASVAGTMVTAGRASPGRRKATPQRVVVMMFDGFGPEYFDRSSMPTLRRWQRDGFYKQVEGVMPSVTNANNASICCGVFPRDHGITGNSYLDTSTNSEEYMESADLLLAPTLFERAAGVGVRGALLSSKKKTISLLSRGASFAVTAEEPPPEWIESVGPTAPIYSREINYWLMQAATHVLKSRPDIGCLYVHTTDYPMHTWAPDTPESREHLEKMDALIGAASDAAPDAAFLLTADHGMNHKRKCYDLVRVLAHAGLPIRASISAERDRYVKHHRGFGGAAWVYLEKAADRDAVLAALAKLPGVESVLTRDETVTRYLQYGPRIGDLCVFGDEHTVFGDLEEPESELPETYRSHGSSHELAIPLFAYNAKGLPEARYFKHNLDLARWLYR